MSTSAVHTGTATATIAFSIMFFSSNIHHHHRLALIYDDDIILVFLLHALADISAIATTTLVRHV
uniref:Putative ovule protein n=1 Tax=Solanum chacoense TaxID=4108 RepID=A0A0V0GMI6_SOLCH